MQFAERQRKRLEILKKIYDCYFESSGDDKRIDTNELIPEDALALDYLVNKCLLQEKTKLMTGVKVYGITALGIDYVEQYWGKTDEPQEVELSLEEMVNQYRLIEGF